MIVDLGPLRWRHARELLEWCVSYQVDLASCDRILKEFGQSPPPPEIDWTIDIPDKYITYFLLKWEET